jgi:hypothetical protein
MKWPDEVMNGQKKVVITKAEKDVEGMRYDLI